jgi:hypothetical protein
VSVTWRTPCPTYHSVLLLVHHCSKGKLQRARADAFTRRLGRTPRGSRLISRQSIRIGIGIALSLTGGCSRDAEQTAQARTAAHRSAAGSIDLPSVAYRPIDLAAIGTISGTVQIDGDPPRDSVVLPSSDREICGAGYPDSSIVHRGNTLANAVVWLSDVKEGKKLPIERRTEIVNEECRLLPRVQAVVAGTTVNVRNEDRLEHTTRFIRGGPGGDTLAKIPLTDDGQVVPNEHIAAKAGMIAATCAQHDWTRGYIAVFESPYFAVTDESGAFRLDSVPPGKYRLLVWHERGGEPSEQEVEVSASGTSRVEMKVKLK